MERKTQEKITLHKKDIYKVEFDIEYWSVIIMPDNIIIDNYHDKEPHIHYNPEKHREQVRIQLKTVEETYNKVIKHIGQNKGLIIKKLIKEL